MEPERARQVEIAGSHAISSACRGERPGEREKKRPESELDHSSPSGLSAPIKRPRRLQLSSIWGAVTISHWLLSLGSFFSSIFSLIFRFKKNDYLNLQKNQKNNCHQEEEEEEVDIQHQSNTAPIERLVSTRGIMTPNGENPEAKHTEDEDTIYVINSDHNNESQQTNTIDEMDERPLREESKVKSDEEEIR